MESGRVSALPKGSNEDPVLTNDHVRTSKQLLYSEKFGRDAGELLNLNESNVIKKTYRPPVSSVLNQVKNFLPKMMEADRQLQQQLQSEPETLDIENITDDKCHIEMNLALVEGMQSDDSDSESDCDSDSDSDSDDGDSLHLGDKENVSTDKQIPPLIPLNKDKKKVQIEIIDTKDADG